MHWRNSNFQYAYYIFGACHTAIEAHRKCMEAIEDRETSLCEAEEKNITFSDNAKGRQLKGNYDQCKREIDFLHKCRLKLEEHIGKVPTMDDYQGNQRLEWRLELERRAENHLLTTGMVPTDHFSTMRTHPDFKLIMKRIDEVTTAIRSGDQPQLIADPWFKDIQLLQAPKEES